MNDPVEPSRRAFLALPIPAAIERPLQAHLDSQTHLRRHYRFLPAANWHLTLHFLGDITDGQVQALTESMAQLALPEARCRIRAAGGFPNAQHARFLCALCDASPELIALQQALSPALRAAGLEPEKRDWRPHITLARLRTGRAPRRLPEAPLDLEFPASPVELWVSHLSSGGSHYESIASRDIH